MLCIRLFITPKFSDPMVTHATVSTKKLIKVIAIAAGKGGVGKTNISINLAIALAQRDKKVLLLDADLGLANVDILLNLTCPYNLSHLLEGKVDLNQLLVTGPCDIKIVPASSGTDYMSQLNPVQHAGIINAFDDLADDYDYLIIDTAAGISDTVLSFASSAQEVVVVICDEPTSLTDAYAFIKVMRKRFEWSQFYILCNMVRQISFGRDLFNRIYRVAEQFLDVRLNYLSAIPFDEHVHEAVKKQQAVILAYPKSPASKAYHQIAKLIEDWPYKYGLRGNTSFFLERLASNFEKNSRSDFLN